MGCIRWLLAKTGTHLQICLSPRSSLFFVKFIPRAWSLFSHLHTQIAPFGREICPLLLLGKNGRERWGSASMMQAKSLVILSGLKPTLSWWLSCLQEGEHHPSVCVRKGHHGDWNAVVLGVGRKVLRRAVTLRSKVEADPLFGDYSVFRASVWAGCSHVAETFTWVTPTIWAHPAWIQTCGYIPDRLTGHLSDQSLGHVSMGTPGPMTLRWPWWRMGV